MLCDACGENEATVHLTQMVNNDVKKVHLCEDCATASGLNVNNPAFFTDMLFGLGEQNGREQTGQDKICPSCQMRHSDYRKTSRLGCPRCYLTFESELAPFISGVQKSCCHVGKRPASHEAGELAEKNTVELKKELLAAVEKEHYEEAARIRDKLNSQINIEIKHHEVD